WTRGRAASPCSRSSRSWRRRGPEAGHRRRARWRAPALTRPAGAAARRRPGAPALAAHVASRLGPGPRRQLRGPVAPAGGRRAGAGPPAPGELLAPEVFVDGGPFVMGTDTEPWAYDNERPAHTVDLPPFWIDAAPVTNGAYLGFVDDGGYDTPRWWSDAGWKWRLEADLAHPQFWRSEGGGAWS